MGEHQSARLLVRRVQDGDRRAFGELIERYRERLEAVVQTRMREHVRGTIEVEDVLQETFTRALRSLGAFQSQAA